MTEMVMGLILGFVVGSFLLSGLMWVAIRRVRSSQTDRLKSQDTVIGDLRRELAADKETNRHLRHQLHALGDGPAGSSTASAERDAARRELAEVLRTLESVRARLADREDKLREYREAVKELRLSLESQDRLRDLISITQDVPADAQAESG